MKKLIIIGLSVILLIFIVFNLKKYKRDYSDPYIEIMDGIDWYFRDGHADLSNYLDIYHDKYRIGVFKEPKATYSDLEITFYDNDEKIFSWLGHSYSSFIVENGILYYVNYTKNKAGGDVIAVDLSSEEIQWTRKLSGLKLENQEIRYNRISMVIFNRQLFVFGEQSNGKYLEVINLKNGYTKENRFITDEMIKSVKERY